MVKLFTLASDNMALGGESLICESLICGAVGFAPLEIASMAAPMLMPLIQ